MVEYKKFFVCLKVGGRGWLINEGLFLVLIKVFLDEMSYW